MILTDVRDTIHADSLALFALNIEILLADVTKSEKSKILSLFIHTTTSSIVPEAISVDVIMTLTENTMEGDGKE